MAAQGRAKRRSRAAPPWVSEPKLNRQSPCKGTTTAAELWSNHFVNPTSTAHRTRCHVG